MSAPDWSELRRLAEECQEDPHRVDYILASNPDVLIALLDRAEKAEGYLKALRAFARDTWDQEQAQWLAKKHGLVVDVPYDPDKHTGGDEYGMEAGDPWEEFAPILREDETS